MSATRARLSGLLALLATVGIVVGLPVVLLALGATPAGMSLPTATDVTTFLTSPDDGTLFLALVQVVAWVAWAFLTLSIVIELLSRLRGVRAPRLPGLRVPQSAARGLVSTMLLLFMAAPLAAQAAPAGPVAPVVMSATTTTVSATSDLDVPALSQPPVTDAISAQAPAPSAQGPEHTVRQGESLWSIAQEHLGSGQRYTEIVDLNREVLGGRADFLEPGWRLQLPTTEAPPPPPASVTVQEGDTLSSIAQEHLGDAERWPEIAAASTSIEQPGGYQLNDPDAIDTGWTLNLPTAASEPLPPVAEQEPVPPVAEQEPLPPAAEQEPLPPAAEQEPLPPAETAAPGPAASLTQADQEGVDNAASDVDEEVEEADGVRTAFGVGALMAAGVVGLIAGRRRLQLRRRPLGQPMPMPSGPAAAVEQDLRAAADVLSVETVDLALRALARECARTGTPLPTLRAARLTDTTFDLYLHAPAALASPWVGTADATVWSLDVADAGVEDASALSEVPAPYPALVTIGHDDEDGHVLLDLEQLTTLAVTGEPETTSAVLAAMAIDLATSHWADDLQVTVVGFYAELEDALQTGRIRYLPSAGRVLEDLAQRVQRDQDTLMAAGTPTLQHARVTGTAPHTWAPELVLVGTHLSEHQLEQLTDLVQATPRMAIAAVTTGPPVGEWQLDLTDDPQSGTGVLQPLGLRLRPQTLPRAQYEQLLELGLTSDVEELAEASAASSEPTLAELAAVREAAPPLESAADMEDVDDVDDEQTQDVPTPGEEEEVAPVAAAGTPLSASPAPAAAEAGTTDDPDVREEDAETVDREADQDAGAAPPAAPTLPRVLVLGPPDVADPQGKVEPTRRGRLVELATYLALHPTASAAAIDDAVWPHRTQQDNRSTRNSATTKLRRWLGRDAEGAELLVYDQATQGYATSAALRCDADEWQDLLGDAPQEASTEDLQAALALVRGRPFEGHHPKKFAWAEPIVQRLIGEIVDASHELGRRRLMEGRWRAAEEAVVIGLAMEPAHEPLWRLRILAAHESRNPKAEAEAVERLLTITEQLDCDLEPETETLLATIKRPRAAEFDQLVANAL